MTKRIEFDERKISKLREEVHIIVEYKYCFRLQGLEI